VRVGTADVLTNAALVAAERGDEFIVPSLASEHHWNEFEAARMAFMRDAMGGAIAARYLGV
jgi:hypothetical protein